MRAITQLRRAAAAATTSLGRRALRFGVAATLDPQPMLARLAPVLVVDVGANRGQFALDVRRVLPDIELICIEPLTTEADVLAAIFADDAVSLIRSAVGSTSGRATMHLSRAADSSSLLPVGKLQQETFPGTDAVGTVDVAIDTLDRLLADVQIPERSLLKIDVQGGELEVLRGAASALASFRWVFVEVSFVGLYVGQPLASEVIEHLLRHGFVISDMTQPTRRAGRTVQVDLLFEQTRPAGRAP